MQKVFEWGFEIAYDWHTDHIHPETVSERDCRFVTDVMSMHKSMQQAYADHQPEEMEAADVAFRGFHSNTETGLYSWALFMVEDQGKWSHLDTIGDGLNSLISVRAAYQRMLDAWEESDDKYDLTPDELRAIITASIHPSNR